MARQAKLRYITPCYTWQNKKFFIVHETLLYTLRLSAVYCCSCRLLCGSSTAFNLPELHATQQYCNYKAKKQKNIAFFSQEIKAT
jgi:hypothetical protein